MCELVGSAMIFALAQKLSSIELSEDSVCRHGVGPQIERFQLKGEMSGLIAQQLLVVPIHTGVQIYVRILSNNFTDL